MGWLERLRGPRSSASEPSLGGRPPALPQGLRVYAVGDVHGRPDLLRTMEGLIARDLAAAPASGEVRLVYLGDLVDRGPDSRGVLDHLSSIPPPRPAARVILRGNHDEWFREFLAAGRTDEGWLWNGGGATLASYGLRFRPGRSLADQAEALTEAAQRQVPASHRELLELAPLSCAFGDYFFCHAGVRPGRPLLEQGKADLLWIRAPFLEHRGELDKVVVHGHTPTDAPEVRRHRIGVDTGAAWTGRLTAVVLEGHARRFLTAEGPPG